MVKLFTVKLKIRNTTLRIFGLDESTVMDVLDMQDQRYQHWLDDDYRVIVSELATCREQVAGTWTATILNSEDDCPFVANILLD